jgi:tetratricopeptide (TPR) repeat protein
MRPGDVVADRFVVEREIASGGMGTVHRAHDRVRGEDVALKVMIGDDPASVARFDREAELLSELDHPALVRYVAHGLTPYGSPFLAMEWLEGEDLAMRLARGALTIEAAVDCGRRVAQALSALHRRGLVHRDVKPSNIFLAFGDPARAKLLDLGVARRIRQADALTGTGVAIGTPYYMAPEQARAARDLDARVDVFAMGAVLFESIAGRPPFGGGNLVEVLGKIVLEPARPLSEIVREVPASLEAIVARCLEKDREQRFEHGGALADALAHVVADARSVRSVPSQSRAIGSSERRVVTVLLVGRADPLAATMQQQAAVSVGSRVREVIASHGASTEHLVEGSTIVALSEPAVPIDQAVRAAKMALAVRAAVPELPLAIATGRAELAGAPVGEAVSRAARALSHAQGGAIRLDEEAASLLALRFEIDRDDRGPILARAAVGARRLLGRATPFVGRDRELALLEGLFHECVDEEKARCALVTAPAGSGKSRLLDELVARLRTDDSVEILSGVADVQRAGTPFGALSSLLRRAAEIYDGEPLPEQHRKLRARLSRSLGGEALEGALPFLGELCGAPFQEDASEALRAARRDPVLMSDYAIGAFEQFVAAECASKPLVLVLDDLHWGDLPSVRAIDGVLRALEGSRLFVLLLARPEIHDLFPRLLHQREMQEVRLGAMGRRACEQLIREALGERATADVTAWIVERAQGNAFFVEELIRAAFTSATRDIPDTVLGVVQARLDALGPDAKRALRAASVFGGNFWKSGVEKLLASDASMEGALRDLVEQEVVASVARGRFPDETELSFRHALIREAAYAMLTDDDRTVAHLHAAEWLEARGAHDPAEIAQHRERGGDLANAAIFWSRAAVESLDVNDLSTANERAERGVACGASDVLLGELRLTQTIAAMWQGDHRSASERSEQSVASLASGSRAWFRAAAEGIAAAGRLGDRDRVATRIERLLSTEAAPDARDEQVIALARTFVPASNARLEVTERALMRAVAVGKDGALGPIARAQLAEARGIHAAMHGRAEESERLLLAAIDAYAEGGAARDRCLTQSSLAWSYLVSGHLDRADAAVDASQAMAAEMRIQTGQAWATHMRGMSLMFRDRHAEARDKLTKAIEIFASQKNARQEGWALAALARVHLALGDAEGAARESLRSIDLLATNPVFLHWPHAIRCRALLALGRVDEALDHAKTAMQLMEPHPWSFDQGHAMRAYVEVLRASNDARAEQAAQEGARVIRAVAEAIEDPEWRASYLAQTDHRWLVTGTL